MNKPVTRDELEALEILAKRKPVVLWTVTLDEETKEPDFSWGEWQMFDGHEFIGDGSRDVIDNYGDTFVAYVQEPEILPITYTATES